MLFFFQFIKNSFFIFFLCFYACIEAYSIVYVHIGPALPKHAATTITQARLFNKECPIYLIANQTAIEQASLDYHKNNVTFVSCESLSDSPLHEKFKNTRHDESLNNFWRYTSERFFYLEEFVSQYNLRDVFHFENDIMLYVDLKELLPILQRHYNGMIAATFENENRCVPGFLYISNPDPLVALIDFLPKNINGCSYTDMEALAEFKKKYLKIFIDYLPIVMPEYAQDHYLENTRAKRAKHPEDFSNHFDEFASVFDGAALGVYLAGMDSTFHTHSSPGKIDPFCIFNPKFFTIDWQLDFENRRIPFITYNNKTVPINNLHITNKPKIPSFYSLPQ